MFIAFFNRCCCVSLSLFLSKIVSVLHALHYCLHSEVAFTHTVREIMGGNVGPLLKSIYEQGSKYLAGKKTTSAGSHSNSMQVDTDATAGEEIDALITSELSAHKAFPLVSLLSVSHLALLLVHGADMVDLTRKLNKTLSAAMEPQSESEEECVSFLEKVFLETAARMNDMEFTMEVIRTITVLLLL